MSGSQVNLTPLALAILGIDDPTTARNPQSEGAFPARLRPAGERRVTSYFSHFQTRCAPANDAPPTYNLAVREARFPSSARYFDGGREVLPKYTCTVGKEGPMHVQLESCSPFQSLPGQSWREAYVVLSGTQLNIYKLKQTHVGKETIIPSAGKLLRSYTLQHAEVGLAPDVSYAVLVPVTKMANLIPTAARRRAYEKDQSLFRVVRQSALRLRVEQDQLVLCEPSEEQVVHWVDKLCAGIDISLAIDERSVPRQCTVPRRRRRPPPAPVVNDLNNQRLIEQQERILQQMYPAFAAERPENNSSFQFLSLDFEAGFSIPEFTFMSSSDPATTAPVSNNSAIDDQVMNDPAANDQELDEIDLSALAEDLSSLQPSTSNSSRPAVARQDTAASLSSLTANNEALERSDFSEDGKWAPPHPRTYAQELRYARRCMPVLIADSPRASSVLICSGRRLRLNYRMDIMEEWSLSPPSYDAHEFMANPSTLQRSNTHASSFNAGSASGSGSASSSSQPRAASPAHDSTMEVANTGLASPGLETPMELDMGLGMLGLEKIRSRRLSLSLGLGMKKSHQPAPAAQGKGQEKVPQQVADADPVVVFGF